MFKVWGPSLFFFFSLPWAKLEVSAAQIQRLPASNPCLQGHLSSTVWDLLLFRSQSPTLGISGHTNLFKTCWNGWVDLDML